VPLVQRPRTIGSGPVVARFSSASRERGSHGSRWRRVGSGIRIVTLRLLQLLRNDVTAVLLVVANLVPVIDLVRTGEPVGSILIIYWMQLVIIGFWNVIKLIVVTRLRALVFVPMFVITYMAIINIFGFIAGGLLDDQMRGSAWQKDFSLSNYWVPAAIFFAVHGVSFVVNFVGRRESEGVTWETQISQPFARALPMWLAATVGAVFGSFLTSATVAAVFVIPVKIALDLFGHFVEHGIIPKSGDAGEFPRG
jgi:hypothetical protein